MAAATQKMHKLVVVVEGETEMFFVERLIRELACKGTIRIEKRKAVGGAQSSRRAIQLDCEDDVGQQFFILIYCSSTDSRVATDIIDNYSGWCKAGYAGIVGLRDVYPASLPQVSRLLSYRQKTKPVQVQNLLAVMEIEAWFLAEHSHFERVDAQLTPTVVQNAVGFDPQTADIEARAQPSGDLDLAYQAAGKRYRKRERQVKRTLDALSYETLYVETVSRVPALRAFVSCLDLFLSGHSWNEAVPALRSV